MLNYNTETDENNGSRIRTVMACDMVTVEAHTPEYASRSIPGRLECLFMED